MPTLTHKRERSKKRRDGGCERGCVLRGLSSSLQALSPSILSGKAPRCFLLQSVAFSLLLGCVAPAPIYRTPDIVEIEVPTPVLGNFGCDCRCECEPNKELQIDLEEKIMDPHLYYEITP